MEILKILVYQRYIVSNAPKTGKLYFVASNFVDYSCNISFGVVNIFEVFTI